MRNLIALVLVSIFLVFAVAAYGQFAGGSGTVVDPWKIASAENLNNIRNYLGSTHSDKYFIQTADIDLGVAPWNQGEGWEPIGGWGNRFYGRYDGNGHIISNLYIYRLGVECMGLFGRSEGDIQNLGLDDVYVNVGNNNGSYYTGGLAGYNAGTISNCYSTGHVSGDYDVGGLAGIGGNITNSYSTADVSGVHHIGGLAGNGDNITNCYSTGNVSGDYDTGGLVGFAGGNISDCYWDTLSSGQTSSAGGEGRTTQEMTFPHADNTYVFWNWSIWKPDADQSVNSGYPYLRPVGELPTQAPGPAIHSQPANASISVVTTSLLRWGVDANQTVNAFPQGFRLYLGTNNPPNNIANGIDLGNTTSYDPNPDFNFNTTYYWKIVPYNQIGEATNCPVWSFTTYLFAPGSGTVSDPWQISTAEQLNNVRNYLGSAYSTKYFLQTADIDLGIAPWNEGEGWVPIGNAYERFFGHYNGGGNTISNLFINRPNDGNQGLFGCISGSLDNLGLENVIVTGKDIIGGLVGYVSLGTINNCFSSGSVTGRYDTGGLVGLTDPGNIINCYSTGSVTGNSFTGGLVGYVSPGTVSNCYSLANVTNLSQTAGGLVGLNDAGTIINCYSKGSISGNHSTGGLIGANAGTVRNGYSTGAVIGDSPSVGGFVGASGGSFINCYWDIQSSGQTSSAGGEGRTTEEMTWPYAANTYVGWDFAYIWSEDPPYLANAGYPYLLSQITQIPNPAVNPSPADQALIVPLDSELSWGADFFPLGKNPPTSFKLFLGTNNPPTNILNGIDLLGSLIYDPPEPWTKNTFYYWQIVPYNHLGEAVNCPVWSFTTTNEGAFAGGSGTESDPWQVATAEQLDYVRNYLGSAHSNKYFIQTADIDLGMAPWNQGEGWVPIGVNYSNQFSGHYDGNGHSIENLYFNRASREYQGLFGYQSGSLISMRLNGVNVFGYYYTGSLVGVNSSGTITNCQSSGSVSGYFYTGGLVGYDNISGTISNCQSSGSVSGDFYTGGLVGYHTGFSSIIYCYSMASVTGLSNVGGFVGGFHQGTISDCYSAGSVSGNSPRGGFVGNTGSYCTISNCYWDIQSSGQTSSAGGEGRTTEEMTWPYAANTYVGWDFTYIWSEDPPYLANAGYPYLLSQITQIPNPAVNPSPADQALIVPLDSELSWGADFFPLGKNPPTSFKLFLGTNNPPTNILNGIDLLGSLMYDPPEPWAENTFYYWQIVPYNHLGEAVNCPIWSFSTHPNPVAEINCDQISFGNVWIDHIATKSFTISNQGDQNLEVTLLIGSEPFSITTSAGRYMKSGQLALEPRNDRSTRDAVSFIVAPASSETAYVHFLPTAQQDYARSLFVETNAPNLPTATISVIGTGYMLYAEFSVDPGQGDVPFEATFTNQSVTGINQSLWDFRDGGTSEEMSPTHTFTQEGTYNVQLTVWDDYFSTSIMHPVTVIAHPLMAYAGEPLYDFGIVYLGDSSEVINLTLQNTGTDTLFVNNIHWKNSQPEFHYAYGDQSTPILPGHTATIAVWFEPLVNGAFSDSLIIDTNAENNPVLKVKFSGRGEYVPPKAPENVFITITGNHAVISWEAVTQTIYDTPLIPDGYLVFLAADPFGTFTFLGFSTALSYIHYMVAAYQPFMFYKVIAYKDFGDGIFDPVSLGLLLGMREEELLHVLKR